MERSGDNTCHRSCGSSLRRSGESLLAGFMERVRDSESPDSILIRNDLSIEAPFTQSLAEFIGLELYEAVNVAFEARRRPAQQEEEINNSNQATVEWKKWMRVGNDESTNVQVEQKEASVLGSCGDDQSKRVEVEQEEDNACDCNGDRMVTIRDQESVERSHGQRRDADAVTLDSTNLSPTDWPLLNRGMEDQRARFLIKNRQRGDSNREVTSIMEPSTRALLNGLDFEYLLEQDKKKREAKKKREEQKRSSRKPKKDRP
ncbi:uncharacterized protein LOC130134984 [Syzygium oleosum]|uniref:uncharacterized protein LOC130134984 n=1 Tax=Syzygium oleosum TaxID=219896 RepID=UPI0024BB7038|nr:uncharacterized protein LOC130134984 [Syzygium oleosum]